jgi:hypothetical protein
MEYINLDYECFLPIIMVPKLFKLNDMFICCPMQKPAYMDIVREKIINLII